MYNDRNFWLCTQLIPVNILGRGLLKIIKLVWVWSMNCKQFNKVESFILNRNYYIRNLSYQTQQWSTVLHWDLPWSSFYLLLSLTDVIPAGSTLVLFVVDSQDSTVPWSSREGIEMSSYISQLILSASRGREDNATVFRLYFVISTVRDIRLVWIIWVRKWPISSLIYNAY